MAMLNASDIANRWAARMGQSGEKIRVGIMNVTEAPTAKAAARVDAMVAGIQRAAAEGKIQRGLLSVTLEDWRSKTLNKGVGRIAQGATEAKGDFQSFMEEFIPHLESGQRKLQSMPRGDVEANIARAVSMMRHNAEFKRSRR